MTIAANRRPSPGAHQNPAESVAVGGPELCPFAHPGPLSTPTCPSGARSGLPFCERKRVMGHPLEQGTYLRLGHFPMCISWQFFHKPKFSRTFVPPLLWIFDATPSEIVRLAFPTLRDIAGTEPTNASAVSWGRRQYSRNKEVPRKLGAVNRHLAVVSSLFRAALQWTPSQPHPHHHHDQPFSHWFGHG